MGLTNTIEKDETAEKILILVEKGETKVNSERAEAIELLETATNLYMEWVTTKGFGYTKANYPHVKEKLNEMVDKLKRYNSHKESNELNFT